MSYDYSSEGKQLELPNPYRVQNQLLSICSVLLITGALFCLWKGRESWLQEQAITGLVPVVIGVGLLLAGLTAASAVASRLRFFFGRGRPASLSFVTSSGDTRVVGDLPSGSDGIGTEVDHVKDMLKQGVLAYPEPKGPLNGLLYHLVPHLITAPMRLQDLARVHFFNLGALLITLLSFGVAYGLMRQAALRPWLSLIYFGFAATYLFRPLLSNQTASLNVQSVVGLVAGALLGPVAIGLLGPMLPSLAGLSLTTQTMTLLISGLAAIVLIVLAILHQVESPPRTQTSSVQRRLSINCPPGLLMDELDRQLQEQWTEKIPNRRYARVEPHIQPDQATGSFQGETIEETQPMPVKSSAAPSIQAAWQSARHRWITALDVYATLLVTLALGLVLFFVANFDGRMTAINHYSTAGTATILILVAVFCQRTAHDLWGRFDFESVVQWVEVAGTFQTGKVGTGNNMLLSRINTENQVTRVEAMTLRVWRARIESVAFGKDAPRQVTALFSTEVEAQNLADHLSHFGQAQSILMAPTSTQDHARLSALGQAEGLLASASPPVQTHHLPAELTAPVSDAITAEPTRFCHACGQKLSLQARYCSGCGTALET